MKRQWWKDRPEPMWATLFADGWKGDALAVGFLVVTIVVMLLLSGCKPKPQGRKLTEAEIQYRMTNQQAATEPTNETVRPVPDGWVKSPDPFQVWRDMYFSDTNRVDGDVRAFDFEGHRYLRNGDSGLIHAESCQCKRGIWMSY